MKTNLKNLFWCLLCAFALNFVTGCVVEPDHRGHGPDYYGNGYGDHHDWDHGHDWDHDHWH